MKNLINIKYNIKNMSELMEFNELNRFDENDWIIFTKSNCFYCVKVKKLLEKETNIKFINCDKYLKNSDEKKKFLNFVKEIIGYEYKTFPMVFEKKKFIGGYNETNEYLNKNFNNNLNISDDF